MYTIEEYTSIRNIISVSINSTECGGKKFRKTQILKKKKTTNNQSWMIMIPVGNIKINNKINKNRNSEFVQLMIAS